MNQQNATHAHTSQHHIHMHNNSEDSKQSDVNTGSVIVKSGDSGDMLITREFYYPSKHHSNQTNHNSNDNNNTSNLQGQEQQQQKQQNQHRHGHTTSESRDMKDLMTETENIYNKTSVRIRGISHYDTPVGSPETSKKPHIISINSDELGMYPLFFAFLFVCVCVCVALTFFCFFCLFLENIAKLRTECKSKNGSKMSFLLSAHIKMCVWKILGV